MLHPWIGAIRNGASIVQGLGAGIGKPHYRILAEPQINRRPIQPETLGPGLRNPPVDGWLHKERQPVASPLVIFSLPLTFPLFYQDGSECQWVLMNNNGQ